MDNIRMDNDVPKAKLRSCSTLNTFYHETRQEIATLSQQIYTRDSIIADLKARLGKYERTCINIEGEEPLVIGPSKSLFESLCKEIGKLKQKLKETEVDAADKLESSKLETQRLQQQVREREQELEAVTRRPDHDKDREIQHLRLALADRERVQATRAVLCTSLAEEAEQLRAQLGATVQVCQELLGRLEKEKKREGRPEELVKETTDSSEVAGVNAQVCKLQEENQQLKKRVAYVESLNAKWQKYDSSREEYVRGLCQRLKESNGLAPAGSGASPTTGAGLGLLQQEIARLNRLLQEKMRERERMGREQANGARRDQEHIQMLEQQVLAYIEDFKSERADRERAQGKILDLQEEVGRLKLQIHSEQSPRDVATTCRVHTGHNKSSRRRTDSAEPLLGNSPEQPETKRTSGHTAQGSARTESRGAADLQCPRCLTTYDDAHAAEYLNHWEECAKL